MKNRCSNWFHWKLHSIEIDESTRHQSADPKWYKIRKERITASNTGKIVKRRAGTISILLNFLCINPTFTFFNERKVVLSVTWKWIDSCLRRPTVWISLECHGYWEILSNYAYMYQCIHIVTFCPTYIPYMNLGVYILWLFVLPTYGTWIKVYIYIYIVTFCPTYIHVKQNYKLLLFVRQGKKYRLWLFVRLPFRQRYVYREHKTTLSFSVNREW